MQAIVDKFKEYYAQYKVLDEHLRQRDVELEEARLRVKTWLGKGEPENAKEDLKKVSLIHQTNTMMQSEGWALLMKTVEMYTLAVSAKLELGLPAEEEEKIKASLDAMTPLFRIDIAKKEVSPMVPEIFQNIESKIDEQLDNPKIFEETVNSPFFQK